MYLWMEMFSLEQLCGMYIRMEMFSGDWLCGMYLRPETIFSYNCIFLVALFVFPYSSASRSHTTSFCRTCVPRGHIPDSFWVVWEGPPYRPHSLADGSRCRRGKGLKTVCLGPTRTSDLYRFNHTKHASNIATLPTVNQRVRTPSPRTRHMRHPVHPQPSESGFISQCGQ